MPLPSEIREADSPLYAWLQIAHQRPGMYYGETPLDAFQGWIDGYMSAVDLYEISDPVIEAMRAGDMNAFFAEQLNLPNKYSGENAYKMIRYVSPSSGKGAFEDFLVLFDDFLASQGVELPRPSISDEILARRKKG